MEGPVQLACCADSAYKRRQDPPLRPLKGLRRRVDTSTATPSSTHSLHTSFNTTAMADTSAPQLNGGETPGGSYQQASLSPR